MSTIGSIALNLHTVDRDEVVYARALNTVSHVDNVALRRTIGTPSSPLRTNMRFERGMLAPTSTNPLNEKSVVISIAATVSPGVNTDDVKAYIAEALTQAATAMGDLAVTGDIHLGT